MKRATIENLGIVDRMAAYYITRDLAETIMMIAVKTRGAHAEVVNLHQLFTTAKLFSTRFPPGKAIVLLTALEWQRLRGSDKEQEPHSGPRREEEKPSSDRKV